MHSLIFGWRYTFLFFTQTASWQVLGAEELTFSSIWLTPTKIFRPGMVAHYCDLSCLRGWEEARKFKANQSSQFRETLSQNKIKQKSVRAYIYLSGRALHEALGSTPSTMKQTITTLSGSHTAASGLAGNTWDAGSQAPEQTYRSETLGEASQ